MEDTLIPILIVGMLFIGLPWLIFHYVTKWKQAATLTSGDEKLLDELHDAARRLLGIIAWVFHQRLRLVRAILGLVGADLGRSVAVVAHLIHHR